MGKYDARESFVRDLDGERHEIPLKVLEETVEAALTRTAVRERAW